MNGVQLRALLRLRWQLTRNQWRRGGEFNAVLTLILLVTGLILAQVGGIVGVVGGARVLADVSPEVMMLVWDGLVALFLFSWAIGIVTDLQRAELIDLSRLLHLPVSLRDVFLLNYLASHFSFSLALLLPAMLGLTVGLVFGRGLAMLLLLPLVCTFFFMITAWTYCLRGWLASLMVNKRRRRAIIMAITMTFVLLCQLPNLLMNVGSAGGRANPPTMPAEMQTRAVAERAQTVAVLEWAHRCVPLLWLPQGAKSLAEGRLWPAVLGAFGMLAMGTWGLACAYRGTLRFYRGGGNNQPAPAPAAAPTTRSSGKLLLERTLPAIPDEATALALASLRSMSRAPEVKMALATNVLMVAILGASLFFHRTAALPAAAQWFMGGAAVAVTFLGLGQVMFNHFGFDRGGFRVLVLLPAARRYILLGKNLAMLPMGLAMFAVYLGLVTIYAHLGASAVVTAVFEFFAAFLAFSVLGNLLSILVPYHIAAGSLKPTKTKILTQVLIFVTYMLMPLAMLPVFLPAGLGLLCDEFGWLPGAAVALACAGVLAVLSALFYWHMLEPVGRLLQRREQRILQVVTQEVE